MFVLVPALYDYLLSDVDTPAGTVSKEQAEQLFRFFEQHPLFGWHNSHNGCEGRADAVCVLLDHWGIPNHKAWVFGGAFLRNHIGGLKQNWNYHVAAALAVQEEGQLVYYVLDPSTTGSITPVHEWAVSVTSFPHSYYCIRQAHWYVFPANKIGPSDWYTRNRQNRKWMIQCLANVNSITATGRAALCFNKVRLQNKALAFEQLKRMKPGGI
jgi:hypothetical protein